ncbi:glycosyltransferase [Granulicella paludicola]|uniref:glycosyltransferase n=1 Tax=Granulicella paludicola TaxID=474951 RepID=UPI0021DF78BB|nr:glycosyltransferase [Granulicella paludicola]
MLHRAATRLVSVRSSFLFPLFFIAVALTHLTLLRLPYFWDEGGYYIPAALDFYHHGWLVPHFTNAHPPLPNVVLGTLWHLTGFHILATRLIVCAFAAAALLAVLRLTQSLLGPTAACTVTLLTAVYPIWYTQSTLAHADIFAAAFTLWAFALYLPQAVWFTSPLEPCHPERSAQREVEGPAPAIPTDRSSRPDPEQAKRAEGKVERPAVAAASAASGSVLPTPYSLLPVALLFALAALSKETAILEPATLAALELYLLFRNPSQRRTHLRWLAALSFPLLPLVLWYAFHHHMTGFTFGNPEYLRYNATANFTAAHIFQAIRYRFVHLFWQRNIWLPILLALACLFLPKRPTRSSGNKLSSQPEAAGHSGGPPALARASAEGASALPSPYSLFPVPCLLILSNWLAFSILGGALLTRYLLPIYPLILLLCVYLWQQRTHYAAAFTAVTALAFISAWWINPPTAFAPEDSLTYRDMIVAHQQAIDYVAQHYPTATVLTAWPVTTDLFKPELGYVQHPIKAVALEDFTRPSLQPFVAETANTGIASYDTAIVFTTHFVDPNLRRYLIAHPNTPRGRAFATSHDLTPQEIATLLGGTVVANFDQHGEWAAVLRFNRSYEARLIH